MSDSKRDLNKVLLKEIDLIQACINRMAQNSFMIKGWTISLVAVVLAVLPESFDLTGLCWLHRRNVRIVLHGHKHIPFFAESAGITVIGCGSSTGQIVHKERGKTFISYNVLKISEKTVTCTQFAEEVYGAGAENIRTEIIEL